MNEHRAKQRRLIYNKTGGKCFYCGYDLAFSWEEEHAENSIMEIDHFVPSKLYGSNHPDNLVPACGFCNSSKNDLHIEEWRKVKTFANHAVPKFSSKQLNYLYEHGFTFPDYKPHLFWFELNNVKVNGERNDE